MPYTLAKEYPDQNPWKPYKMPAKTDTDEEGVFVLKLTNEVFATYEEYIARYEMYKQEIWCCKISGRSNITFEEALESEAHCRELIKKVHPVFYPVIINLVLEKKMVRLDSLVDDICAYFKVRMVVGETAEIVQRSESVPVLVVKEIAPAKEGDKYTYLIRPLKGEIANLDSLTPAPPSNGSSSSSSSGSSNELVVPMDLLKRKKDLLSKTVIRYILREIGEKERIDTPWTISNEALEKYGLGHLINPEKPEKKTTAKRKRPASQSSASSSSSSSSDSSQPPSKRPRINGTEPEEPITGSPPVPSTDFLISTSSIGPFFMSWSFLNNFGKALKLSPFSVEDFESSLLETDNITINLIVEIHCVLYRVIVPKRSNSLPKIDVGNWEAQTKRLLESYDGEFDQSLVSAWTTKQYNRSLTPEQKITIINFLCEKANETELITEAVNEYFEISEVRRKEKREKAMQLISEVGKNAEGKKAAEVKQIKSDALLALDTQYEKSAKQSIRMLPLGLDRYYNRYWYWPAWSGRILVETGQCNLEMSHKHNLKPLVILPSRTSTPDPDDPPSSSSASAAPPSSSSSSDTNSTSSEPYEPLKIKTQIKIMDDLKDRHDLRPTNTWGYYETKAEFEELMNYLNAKWEREKKLLQNLKKEYDQFVRDCEKRLRDTQSLSAGPVRRSTRIQSRPTPSEVRSYLQYVNRFK